MVYDKMYEVVDEIETSNESILYNAFELEKLNISFADDTEYKFSEDRILKELKAYIDKTYGQHYAQTKFQASEFIIDNGHGEGFFIGNIMKYAQRYGKKNGHNRDDLMKVVHYAILALHNHDMTRK
jgi:hypothetical protein